MSTVSKHIPVPKWAGEAGHQREGQELPGVPGGCREYRHEEPQGKDCAIWGDQWVGGALIHVIILYCKHEIVMLELIYLFV